MILNKEIKLVSSNNKNNIKLKVCYNIKQKKMMSCFFQLESCAPVEC